MAVNSNKEKHISVRVTNATHSEVTTYAKAHNYTFSKAVEVLLESGLKAEHQQLATKTDIELLLSDNKRRDAEEQTRLTLLLDAIKNQPITVQQLQEPEEKRSWLKLPSFLCKRM